jgi:hypothetical protein
MFISFLFLFPAFEIEAGLVFVSVERPTLVCSACPIAPTVSAEVPVAP